MFGGLIAAMGRLQAAIRTLAMSHRKPLVFVSIKRQEATMALVYSVTAGSPVDSDVVQRELTVVVDGQESSKTTFTGSATALGEVKVPQGASVVLTLVDIDDAENRSQPATVEFVATDTIAPARPGEFGVTLSREE